MTPEIEELLDTLERACKHEWVANRKNSWDQYVGLCDPDSDRIGFLETADTLTAIRQIREALGV